MLNGLDYFILVLGSAYKKNNIHLQHWKISTDLSMGSSIKPGILMLRIPIQLPMNSTGVYFYSRQILNTIT